MYKLPFLLHLAGGACRADKTRITMTLGIVDCVVVASAPCGLLFMDRMLVRIPIEMHSGIGRWAADLLPLICNFRADLFN